MFAIGVSFRIVITFSSYVKVADCFLLAQSCFGFEERSFALIELVPGQCLPSIRCLREGEAKDQNSHCDLCLCIPKESKK